MSTIPRNHTGCGPTECGPTDPYFGGKGAAGVFQTHNQIAPHDVFISLFLGHCRVLQNIRQAPECYGYDLNSEVVRRWRNVAGVKVQRSDALAVLADFVAEPHQRYCLYCDPPVPVRHPYQQTPLPLRT